MTAVLSETVKSEFGVEMWEELLIKYSCNRINTGEGEDGKGVLAGTPSCTTVHGSE